MRNIDGLKKNSQFSRVYKLRRSLANSYLIMYIAPNDMEVSRIGISASKKIGNSVVRHRVSRLVREAYRLHKGELAGGYDMVVVARPDAAQSGYSQIEEAYLSLLKRHNIFKAEQE